jgi:hypothetical protein
LQNLKDSEVSGDRDHNDNSAGIDDYVELGLGAIWIVDPRRRTMATAGATGIYKVRQFRVPGTPLTIGAGELFAELDEPERLT